MKNYICVCLVVFVGGCANIIPPSGGPKDLAPPLVVSSTPENPAINFNGDLITIWFDEYIQIDNVNNIRISPLCEPKPEIYVKGKKIEIYIDCELDSTATYTINFGKSIIDINEGNILTNFKYVFSKKNSLDSLSFKGNVRELYFDQPVNGALIALSNNLDSLQPYYYSFSNSQGDFDLENIQQENYMLFAFFDENNNLKHDSNELTSYPEKITKIDVFKNIHLFKDESETSKLQATNNSTNSVCFNNLPPQDSVSVVNVDGLWFRSADTSLFWFKDKVPYIHYNYKNRMDSVQIYSVDSVPKMKLQINSQTHNIATNNQIIIKSNSPIIEINQNKFKWNNDTLKKVPTLIDDFTVLIYLESTLQEANTLSINTGAIIGTFQPFNDSTFFDIDLKKENYGNLSIFSKNVAKNTILELFKNDEIIRRCTLQDTTHMSWIEPGEYQLRAFIDNNKNQRWDTGNIQLKKTPETIKVYHETISVRKNWDINLTISAP